MESEASDDKTSSSPDSFLPSLPPFPSLPFFLFSFAHFSISPHYLLDCQCLRFVHGELGGWHPTPKSWMPLTLSFNSPGSFISFFEVYCSERLLRHSNSQSMTVFYSKFKNYHGLVAIYLHLCILKVHDSYAV